MRKNEVLAHVMVLACDGWRRGSHGLKGVKDEVMQAQRAKSRPEGPPARSRAPDGP